MVFIRSPVFVRRKLILYEKKVLANAVSVAVADQRGLCP